jgi:hypothetical protein
MKITEARKILRNHKGHVMVAMMMRNDCPYVRVVFSDLMELLSRTADGEIEVHIQDGVAYVDSANEE